MLLEPTKIKKADFEQKLIELYGKNNLSAFKHIERQLKGDDLIDVPMTLYYTGGSKHVGTYSKGKGWIF